MKSLQYTLPFKSLGLVIFSLCIYFLKKFKLLLSKGVSNWYKCDSKDVFCEKRFLFKKILGLFISFLFINKPWKKYQRL